MTYCVALRLKEGMVFASDSRTNAGVDHIACFRKLAIFKNAGDRMIVIQTAGNLATTQSVISQLQHDCRTAEHHLMNAGSMYEVAEKVGEKIRKVIQRDNGQAQGVDFTASILVGGQIRGEEPRLFNVYPQGNFIEASEDTPYFQIGESKYGKPIIDRVVDYDTPLDRATQCVMLSMDSTLRSNLSVGLPIDLLIYQKDALDTVGAHRIEEDDASFNELRTAWGKGMRELFDSMPSLVLNNTSLNGSYQND